MKLSYGKVFDRYTMSFSDKLAELSYSLYKTLRLRLAKIFPLSEHEKYRFDDDPFSKEESADMPQGFDYIKRESVDGFVKLDYPNSSQLLWSSSCRQSHRLSKRGFSC